MRVEISIRTAGAAFCDEDGEPDEWYKAQEVSRIMREVTERVQNGQRMGTFRDLMGNAAGSFTVAEEG